MMSGESLALGICGSARHGGNTDLLIREALRGAAANGMRSEVSYLADLKIEPCKGCNWCKDQSEQCVIHDDLDMLLEKVRQAGFIVIGSPIYMRDVTGQTKILLDRMYSALTPEYDYRLRDPQKKGLAIITCEETREGYTHQAVSTLQLWLGYAGVVEDRVMVLTEQGLPPTGVAIKDRPEALARAFALGAACSGTDHGKP